MRRAGAAALARRGDYSGMNGLGGVFLSNPYGLLALASLLAVAAAYLFYQRYRPRKVTGLFLWGVPPRSLRGGRNPEPPRLSRSLILDLLAALLLALAIASPAWHWRTGRMPVVILDGSFSMRAYGNYERALARCRKILADAEQPAAVILAGEFPRLLTQPDTHPALAAQELSDYNPYGRSADFPAALKLAETLYPQQLEIHVITDHSISLSPRKSDTLTAHLLSGRGGNPAFSGLWRQRQSGGEAVFARISNYSPLPTKLEYRILAPESDNPDKAEENVVFTKTLSLESGEVADCEAVLSGVPGLLRLELNATSGEDLIAEDSLAFLPPPPLENVGYALDGLDPATERFFRLGLDAAGAHESTPVVSAVNADSTEAGAALTPSLLVTSSPKNSGRVLTLELPPENKPVTYSPPFVIDLASALCRDVQISSGYWTAASSNKMEAPEGWLIAADRNPLFWKNGRGRYMLNLIPQKSSIVASSAWPALMTNLVIEARRNLPGLGKSAYNPAATLDFRPYPERTSELQLFSDSFLIQSADAGAYLSLPLRCGLYHLRQGENDYGALSVLPLYENESDTRILAEDTQEQYLNQQSGGWQEATVYLFWLPLLLALVLLLLNWWLGDDSEHARNITGEGGK